MQTTRRQLLQSASCGFGYLALKGLASQASAAPEVRSPLDPRPSHFPGKAKRVIFMFMQGGPSHLDTFDYKPSLIRYDGSPLPASYDQQRLNRAGVLMKSPHPFRFYGQSGLPMSSLFTNLSQHADDLCLLNGMYSDTSIHAQGTVLMHTGNFRLARPSVGSWITYGLGSESRDLPGFVVLNPLGGNIGGSKNYSSGFLPSSFEGTPLTLGNRGEAIPNIRNPRLSATQQRQQLDFTQTLNRDLLQQVQVNTELEGVIESYERGFRMQSGLPRVMDVSGETSRTLEMYGRTAFGTQCLLARKMAEAGVRFIEINQGGWDHHANIGSAIANGIRNIDQPIAALLTDLKQRGMLDETLIVWGGEFGRTATRQGNSSGRDHNGGGYSYFMAGGGIKGGMRYGATNDLGTAAEENKIHVNDLHATILNQLGMNHERLTYRYAGRDFRLTDVAGRVMREIIA